LDGTVGRLIQAFKSIVTVEYIRGVKNYHWQRFIGKLWQRSYWEHIIRDDDDYYHLAEYIQNNHTKWALDSLNAAI